MIKSTIKFLIALLCLLAPVISPSYAGNDREFLLPVDSTAYDLYVYPTGDAVFSVPFDFDVRFQICNGKYFYFAMEDMIGTPECNFDVYFYTPNGALIDKQHIKYMINSYNIPQNAESAASDVLNVIIVNNGNDAHRNFKFVVAVPKEAIKAHKSNRKFDKFE